MRAPRIPNGQQQVFNRVAEKRFTEAINIQTQVNAALVAETVRQTNVLEELLVVTKVLGEEQIRLLIHMASSLCEPSPARTLPPGS